MDDFFKRIKQEIDKGITVVGAKSKEIIDTAKINTRIGELKDEKDKMLREIGMIVYKMSQDI